MVEHPEAPGPWGVRWSDGNGQFNIWAPAAREVTLELDGRKLPMHGREGGLWTVDATCRAGAQYRFGITLGEGTTISVADPASRLQQGDVDDPSLVVDSNAFRWMHSEWRGRPWHEAVVYELHIGVLGGFGKATQHLAALAALGVTAIELMPVGDFPGSRNWGYDGVLPYAPDAAYGTPADLKRLIDTAHGLGLMVLLDVVYNHFGPDGNFVGQYAPCFFHSEKATAWGGAIDFGRQQVRDFFTANALYWVNEYRFDGLRIDAAHAIDHQDWLQEMAQAVRGSIDAGRHVHLILEHDGNAAGLLMKDFDAQWNDDAHHIMHVLLTGETDGYYRDYADQPAARLARCLAQGFDYQGEASLHRGGAARGEPSAGLPPTAFVFFLQNHDQTGNRAFGERLTTLAHPAALRAAQALQLLSPHIPLIFMGEESASTEPFLYFTSHRTTELADAVRRGRWQEFAANPAFSDERLREKIADPNDEKTFQKSVPASIGERGEHSTVWVRDLLALRHSRIVPDLPDCQSLGAQAVGPAAVCARWQLGAKTLVLVANLAAENVDARGMGKPLIPGAQADTLFDSGGVRHAISAGSLPGHACLAWLEPA